MRNLDVFSNSIILCNLSCSRTTLKTLVYHWWYAYHSLGNLGLDVYLRLSVLIPIAGTRPVGMGLHRTNWVKFNRLRNNVEFFYLFRHKSSIAFLSNCECIMPRFHYKREIKYSFFLLVIFLFRLVLKRGKK